MEKSKKESKFERLIKIACKNYEKKLYIKKKKIKYSKKYNG